MSTALCSGIFSILPMCSVISLFEMHLLREAFPNRPREVDPNLSVQPILVPCFNFFHVFINI